MVRTEEKGEKVWILQELQTRFQKVNPDSKVFYQRACTNLYYDLLGDWREWKEVTKIKNPNIRSALIERIKKLLYWEKES